MNLAELTPESLAGLSDEDYRQLLAKAVDITQKDRQSSQILYYKPASARAQLIHESKSKVVAAGGGNGSGKSETVLVEMIMCATGVFPYSQRHLIEQKFRGPIQCRVVVESLTTTLETIIIPKLQWWKWTGIDQQGGERGHWGWIPRDCLIEGEWDKSWSAKLRVLRLVCRDPNDSDKVLGESIIQFMSRDQDSTDFASGDFHFVMHDEPPTLAIWRENEARTMRVDGRLFLAMTWPDDPSINVDWLYDEVYEPGRTGSNPEITWLELWTTENKNLKQEAVAAQANKWSEEITNVRIYGKPIRFSNRIHFEFTQYEKTWCFRCDKSTISVPVVGKDRECCGNCGAEEIVRYNHVQEFDHSHSWPTIFVIDPHPRKAICMLYCQITPSDDWNVIAELKVADDCVKTRKEAERLEMEMGINVVQRLMDPNMGASPSGQRREVSWQDEYAAAGLVCELASDIDIGRARINTMLKPDSSTLAPRLIFHKRCKDAVYQFERFSWDDFSKRIDKDQKQTPKAKFDDFPACLRYVANSEPDFRYLRNGAPVIQRPGKRRGAYG